MVYVGTFYFVEYVIMSDDGKTMSPSKYREFQTERERRRFIETQERSLGHRFLNLNMGTDERHR